MSIVASAVFKIKDAWCAVAAVTWGGDVFKVPYRLKDSPADYEPKFEAVFLGVSPSRSPFSDVGVLKQLCHAFRGSNGVSSDGDSNDLTLVVRAQPMPEITHDGGVGWPSYEGHPYNRRAIRTLSVNLNLVGGVSVTDLKMGDFISISVGERSVATGRVSVHSINRVARASDSNAVADSILNFVHRSCDLLHPRGSEI